MKYIFHSSEISTSLFLNSISCYSIQAYVIGYRYYVLFFQFGFKHHHGLRSVFAHDERRSGGVLLLTDLLLKGGHRLLEGWKGQQLTRVLIPGPHSNFTFKFPVFSLSDRKFSRPILVIWGCFICKTDFVDIFNSLEKIVKNLAANIARFLIFRIRKFPMFWQNSLCFGIFPVFPVIFYILLWQNCIGMDCR